MHKSAPASVAPRANDAVDKLAQTRATRALINLSTVLAQDHFYSDFLSLLLTKQIHFESVMMIASAQHSLSVLTFVKLMIACVVHLLSRFVFQNKPCMLSSIRPR